MMSAPTSRLSTRFTKTRILPRFVMIDPPAGAAALNRPALRSESLPTARAAPTAPIPPRLAGREYAEQHTPCQAYLETVRKGDRTRGYALKTSLIRDFEESCPLFGQSL